MMTMSEHTLYFKVDGLTLSGILHLPDQPPRALIVGVHGLMSDKNSPKQIALAKRLTSIKMAYLRFDHRGCGDSEGDFNEQTTMENRRSDLLAAIQAAQHMVGKTIPVGLFGSSLGGTICLTAAKQMNPFAMVTLAAPVQSRSIQLPTDSPESLKSEIVGRRLTFNIKEMIDNVHHILILHGSVDETVPAENADTIYRLSTQPKQKIVLENGDHRVSNPEHQQYFIETAARWFETCYQAQSR
ncbi:alpha/beta hydrolase [Desulfosarcina variabilis]|uniref:alpha/beta hydrolase n=1 Tax=Desulfosarcina variabilis TaxID=2300 RepID=UPI003AFAC051